MLHTFAEIGRVKATCDHCSQVGAFDTVIFIWYLPASTICSYLREVISALSCSNDKVVVVVVICFAFQSGA